MTTSATAALIGWCRVVQREGWQLVSEAEATEALRLARGAIEAGKDDPDTLWMAGTSSYFSAATLPARRALSTGL